MFYQEDNGRMRVIAPSFLYEGELSPTLTIRLEGIYNAISGASPTGAPPAPAAAPAPATGTYSTYSAGGGYRAEDDEHEGDDDEFEEHAKVGARAALPFKAGKFDFLFKAGATPPPPPPPPSTPTKTQSSSNNAPSASPPPAASSGKLPRGTIEDTRVGFNVSLIQRAGRHTPTLQCSYSSESDYKSLGVALTDAIEFNKKNTTFTCGGAYTYDRIEAFNMASAETKGTVDAILGVTQLINPEAFFTVNLTLSRVNGYLTDPYKVVELNGAITPERRPDSKDKFIFFCSLNRFFRPLDGAAEVSYRWYGDSFGIRGNTVQLAWFQKLERAWVLSPSLRFYDQTQADFYAVRFEGDPDYYSADYRISAMQSLGFGLKLIWTPSDKLSLDLAYDRYVQRGNDSVTPTDAYPSANVITAGARLWF